MSDNNHLGLKGGVEFVEFVSPDPKALHRLFLAFGFSRVAKHESKDIDYYRQNDIHFFINKEAGTFAGDFAKKHGPSACSMGWRFEDANFALKEAVARGAKERQGDYTISGAKLPAIRGIGESLIYFVDNWDDPERYRKMGFVDLENPDIVEQKGFITIDHLTNNVRQGEMKEWVDFYERIFGFTSVRYFDIRGIKTGLTSFAMQAPDRSFCIPINEASDKKSQINEFLEEYNGPGIQHIAFLSHDICHSVDMIQGTEIETLDIDDEYYEDIFDRVPNVTEPLDDLHKRQILVDGDLRGYLLQIFTRNVIGPIFIEIIRRKNNFSFGEGNFGALFRSIERDQQRRGYLT